MYLSDDEWETYKAQMERQRKAIRLCGAGLVLTGVFMISTGRYNQKVVDVLIAQRRVIDHLATRVETLEQLTLQAAAK